VSIGAEQILEEANMVGDITGLLNKSLRYRHLSNAKGQKSKSSILLDRDSEIERTPPTSGALRDRSALLRHSLLRHALRYPYEVRKAEDYLADAELTLKSAVL